MFVVRDPATRVVSLFHHAKSYWLRNRSVTLQQYIDTMLMSGVDRFAAPLSHIFSDVRCDALVKLEDMELGLHRLGIDIGYHDPLNVSPPADHQWDPSTIRRWASEDCRRFGYPMPA